MAKALESAAQLKHVGHRRECSSDNRINDLMSGGQVHMITWHWTRGEASSGSVPNYNPNYYRQTQTSGGTITTQQE